MKKAIENMEIRLLYRNYIKIRQKRLGETCAETRATCSSGTDMEPRRCWYATNNFLQEHKRL